MSVWQTGKLHFLKRWILTNVSYGSSKLELDCFTHLRNIKLVLLRNEHFTVLPNSGPFLNILNRNELGQNELPVTTRKLTAEDQRLVSEGSYLLKGPLKSQIPISRGGGGPTVDAESKNAKIPNFHVRGGGCWQPTFDAESKNAKIPNSHVQGGWVGGWGGWVGGLAETNFQKSWAEISNLMQSPENMECMEFGAAT